MNTPPAEIQVFALEEFKTWILSQPPERKLDMSGYATTFPCGCLLVQFELEKGFEDFTCGFDMAATNPGSTTLFRVKDSWPLIKRMLDARPQTFGEAQTLLSAL